MSDASVLPATFEEWRDSAHQAEEQVRRKGIATVRVHVDGDDFVEFCRVRGLHLDAEARNEFANANAARLWKAPPGGQG